MNTEVILAIIAAVSSGLGFLVKYILNSWDKKHQEEIEERNRKRDAIEKEIADLKGEVKDTKKKFKRLQIIVMSCDKPDCPSKLRLKEELEKDELE